MEDDKLAKIAKELGVTVEAIKNFSEEGVVTYFNTFNNNDFSNSQNANFGPNSGNYCSFHPLDKLMEVYAEKERLYERLLQAEREKNSLL